MTYYFEMPDGSRLSQEQYNEQRAKQIDAEIAAEHQEQNEAARLLAELSEAYKACSGYMKSHPALVRKVGDAEAQEHDLYLKLRQNLERADQAPRCEKVSVDGTVCECPRMKGYSYCYAHERMLQARPRKLALPALEDANAIQLSIMMVQKALIDDEISEKKAGLLLYSLQIASSNAKQTTFIQEEDKEVVTEMPEEEASKSKSKPTTETQRHGERRIERMKIENRESGNRVIEKQKPGTEDPEIVGSGETNTQQGDSKATEARRKPDPLPQINAEERRLGSVS